MNSSDINEHLRYLGGSTGFYGESNNYQDSAPDKLSGCCLAR